MRLLNADDLFSFSAMIRETGVKDEFQKLSEKTQGKKNVNVKEVGTELILNVISNCGTKEAKTAIFDFLSGPIEKSTEEIRTMDLRTFTETIEEMITMNSEDLKYFFKKALDLIQRN